MISLSLGRGGQGEDIQFTSIYTCVLIGLFLKDLEENGSNLL